MNSLSRVLTLTMGTAVLLALAPQARADIKAAEQWVSKEFTPSTLSRAK